MGPRRGPNCSRSGYRHVVIPGARSVFFVDRHSRRRHDWLGLRHQASLRYFRNCHPCRRASGRCRRRKVGRATMPPAENEADADTSGSDGDVELTANSGGHFQTQAEVNGREIDVMVDTGATLVALTYEDAESAGLYSSPRTSPKAYGPPTARPRLRQSLCRASPSATSPCATSRRCRGTRKTAQDPARHVVLGRLSRVEMRATALVLHE